MYILLACCLYLYVLSDAPEAPENLQASDIHADNMKLSWLPPSDDGGSDITGQLQLFIAFELEVCASILFVLQPFTAKHGVVTILYMYTLVCLCCVP